MGGGGSNGNAPASGNGGGGGGSGEGTNRSGGRGADGLVVLTFQAPATGTTLAATSITAAAARLNATIDALDVSATVTFEYGLTTAYGSSVNATPFGISAGTTGNVVQADISGLSPSTLYHFRVKVVSALGTTYGSDLTFTTLGPALTKTASSGAGRVGDVITFAIVYNNPLATDILNATVTDVLPSGMTYSTAAPTTGTVAVSGQTVTWTIPIIPAGGSAQLTLAVNLVSQGVLTNTVTAAGAVTHYKMDETSSWTGAAGQILDAGTTGLHGRRVLSGTSTTTNVFSPSPTIAAQNPSVVGGFCNAGRFDGNAVVEVPASTLFGYTNKLSASAWIYLTAYPSSGLYSVLSNDVNYEFHIDSNGKLYWWWNASTLTSSASIPLNQWTHVAITFSSATGAGRQRIYINGVQDTNTNNWTGTLQQNSCQFYIGGDIATGSGCALIPKRNFRGNIDEVKLYNYELSASEVQADMTLGRNCSGTFDHIRIEHDGTGSVCTPETVTVKACLNSSCTSLYTGSVQVNLTPTGWTGGDTFTFSGGVTTRSLGVGTPSTVTLGVASTDPLAVSSAKCYNGSTQTCSMTFASASCNFDAVEVGANPKTRLFTKMAGTAFNVDILALTGSSVNTAVNSAVNVDLVDSSATDCPSGTGLTTAQSVTLVNGRKTASFTYAQARPNVRVRVQQGASAAACSTDNFAIRPASITLVTGANATPSSASSTPAVKAGTSFTLYGTTTTGYSANASLDTAKLSAQVTSQDTTQAAGGVVGTLGLASLPVNAAPSPSNNATYSEAGYLYLAAGAYRDEAFTSVDQPGTCTATGTCDCVTDTTSNNNLSTALVGSTGKYGCHIGNTAASLGRFIPDRFVVTTAAPVAGCTVHPAAGAGYTPTDFTYFANPAGFNTPFTLTAVNGAATPATTQNYSGKFARISSGGWSWTDVSSTTGLRFGTSAALPAGAVLAAATTGGTPVVPVGTWSNGVANITTAQHQISRPTALVGETSVSVTAWPADADGVTMASAATVSTAPALLRFGRVRMQNAYGSERLALALPIQAQSWNGNAFVRNADDSCTPLTVPAGRTLATGESPDGAANVYFYPVAGKNKLSSSDTTRSMGSTLVGGNLALGFTAPSNGGWADVILNVPDYLKDNHGNCMGQTGATGARDDMPCARATFGVYKSPLIYRRENY